MSTTVPTPTLRGLIWVQSLVEDQRDRDHLIAESGRLFRLKPSPARTAVRTALYSGAYYLDRHAREAAEHARDRGLLPYCWEGTKVLKGGAA